MNDKLIKKYLAYANTDEAFAVLFVKKYLPQLKGHWIDVADCERYEMSSDNLHFRFVVGGLYDRKIKPVYPPKSLFTKEGQFDERRYLMMIRAITWETAHKDIAQQKPKRLRKHKFKIIGVSYDKNKHNKNFFREDTPPDIKELEKNLSDRTNPLWDKALEYANRPEFVYKIRQVNFD